MSILPALALPYGMRDVKLTPYNTAGALGTAVDLPAMQTLSFSEAEEFSTLRGDDGTVAIRGRGATVGWDLESGGVSLAAWAIIAGGTVTETGIAPSRVRKLAKKGTDVRPYFKAQGQAISDSGGDFHAILFKLRATGDLEGEMADGEFWVSSASGEGIPDANGDLYHLIQNEAITAIA